MSVKARTIDNLGIESSSRYARDQQTLDPNLVRDSRFIPSKTEVASVTPYFPLDLQEYLLPERPIGWACFEPPAAHLISPSLFSYQLIPSLGGYEKREADVEKLEALEDALHKQFREGKRDGQEEGQKEEKERKTLMELLKTLGKLERSLSLINSRRHQYQRG